LNYSVSSDWVKHQLVRATDRLEKIRCSVCGMPADCVLQSESLLQTSNLYLLVIGISIAAVARPIAAQVQAWCDGDA